MAPVNWPGLMAWSTKHHDGTQASEFKPLSDEDRKFLEAAMQEAFSHIEDPNQIMLEAVNLIKSEERTDATIITALEIIDRCCDDPDCARNADKLGGMQTLIDLAQAKGGCIRVRTLEILALFLSNNPSMQEVGLRRGFLEVFLGLVRNAPVGSEERLKAFRSLVALVRAVDANEDKFMKDEGGIKLVVECLGCGEDARTREKALNYVTSLGSRQRLQKEVKRSPAALAPPLALTADGSGRSACAAASSAKVDAAAEPQPEAEAEAEETSYKFGPDADLLASAVLPLFSDLTEASMQYKETLATCVLALANTPEMLTQREALREAVVARLVILKTEASEDAETELATLLECREALGKSS